MLKKKRNHPNHFLVLAVGYDDEEEEEEDKDEDEERNIPVA
jgi:hypothetical protein